jgi:phosphoenolpyruvate-protein phosphotransferase
MATLSFRGTGASPGIGEGRALIVGGSALLAAALEAPDAPLTSSRQPLAASERGDEIERFHRALSTAGDELSALGAGVRSRLGDEHAAVFEAQALFLQDPALVLPVEESIRTRGEAAAAAIARVFEDAATELEGLNDAYLAARAADLRDVKARLLRLLGGAGSAPEMPNDGHLNGDTVVIARDLTPSDTVALPLDSVRGVVLAGGTTTAHAAILARGLGLPLVVGAGTGILQIRPGQTVLVDGTAGTVLVEPKGEERAVLQGQAETRGTPETGGTDHGPALTRDGRRIELLANASSPAEARMARGNGAEGIGLLRTEFLLATLAGERAEPPVDVLTAAYAGIFRAAGDMPVTVRVMDAGGDKPLPFLHFGEEANPFLGWRGIRILLDEQELFAAQLRAVLRAAASTGTDLRLMIPMVTASDEMTEARRIVQGVCRSENVVPAHPLQIGVMIETPAAALIAGALAREADFFSIGTNDLVQYTLACDRGNPRVAAQCRPEHPAVLRLIHMTVGAAHDAGIPVGVCGEVAGDPALIPLLLGLGMDELSVGPARLPAVRGTVQSTAQQHAADLAAQALQCATADEVRAVLSREP